MGCAGAAVLLVVSQYEESPALTWALVATAAALRVLRGVDLLVRDDRSGTGGGS